MMSLQQIINAYHSRSFKVRYTIQMHRKVYGTTGHMVTQDMMNMSQNWKERVNICNAVLSLNCFPH